MFAVSHSKTCVLWPDAILNKLKYSHPDFHLCTSPQPKNNFEYADMIETAADEAVMATQHMFLFYKEILISTYLYSG